MESSFRNSRAFKIGGIALFGLAMCILAYELLSRGGGEKQGFVAENPSHPLPAATAPGMRALTPSAEAMREAVRPNDPAYLNSPKATDEPPPPPAPTRTVGAIRKGG